jgi:hypothetical protein
MAELSLVYGENDGNYFSQNDYETDKQRQPSMGGSSQMQQMQQMQHSQNVQQQVVQQAQQSQQAQQPVVMMKQQGSNVKEGFQNMSPQEYVSSYRKTSYSFWDKMTIKRPEVMKLAIFSLVIVLAIAIDKMTSHYLSKYISENIFTDFQEFMVRLSYPVLIFLLLWILKSL